MAWYTWIILALGLGAAIVFVYKIQNHESGATSCIGCGECAKTGECVLKKKSRQKKSEKKQDPS